MYCTRCGKKIDYEAFVCNECVQKEEAAFAEVNNETTEPVVETMVVDEPAVTATEDQACPPVEEPVNTQPTSAPTGQQYGTNPTPNAPYTPYTPYQPQSSSLSIPSSNFRMIGFGKALASTILSAVGYLFCILGIQFAVYEPGVVAILIILAVGLSVPALIMGIQSIKTSSRVASRGLPRPIATLILGIVGIGTAAMNFFFCLMALEIVGGV